MLYVSVEAWRLGQILPYRTVAVDEDSGHRRRPAGRSRCVYDFVYELHYVTLCTNCNLHYRCSTDRVSRVDGPSEYRRAEMRRNLRALSLLHLISAARSQDAT